MTRDDWDEMVTVPYGDFGTAAAVLKESLAELESEPFMVYGNYELVPSATPELPVDTEHLRIVELVRENPGSFGWYAYSPDKERVTDEPCD